MYRTVDNYLSADAFQLLTKELDDLDLLKAGLESNTEIEKGKSVFKLENLPSTVSDFIKKFAGDEAKDVVREMTGWDGEVISLLELEGFAGYAPYHTMKSNGFLGSHIDHTFIKKEGLIKFANCIFYSNSEWKQSWGGETVFFDKSGFFQTDRVAPKPNRMLFFTHDVEGFHGVLNITCPDNIHRRTFYMDFYIHGDDLAEFSKKFLEKNSEKFIYAPCLITFIPVQFSGVGFNPKAIFSRNFLGYLRNYFRYLNIKYSYKLKKFNKGWEG